MSMPPSISGHRPPGWWARNWKWAVPVGLMCSVVLFCGGILALFAGVLGMMKQTDVYQIAFAEIRRNPEVIAALGTPIDAGWMASGNVRIDNDTGDARLDFSVSGPKGEGKAYVDAHKSAGHWDFRLLAVDVVEGNRRIIVKQNPALPTAIEAPPMTWESE